MIFQISLIVLFLFAVDVFTSPIPQQKPLTGVNAAKRPIGEITKFDHVDNADGSYYFVTGKLDSDIKVELTSFEQKKIETYKVTGNFESVTTDVLDVSDVSDTSNASESYETSDAQRREEHGEFKGGKGKGVLTIQGTYSYTQPDGTAVNVQYIADDRGFRLVPTNPKIHAIAKGVAQKADALAYNDAALASGIAPRIGSAQVASLVGGGLGDNYEDESKLIDYKSEDYDY